MNRRVLVLHTGGTLGMRQGDDGLWRPSSGHLASLLARMPELRSWGLPTWELFEFDTLLDSANMTPGDWNRIGQAIAASPEFDGFVVVHGTDTMAYTASALSFALQGLDRPVVFTGSQIPLARPRTDARENLASALLYAADPVLAEVCLYFNGHLLRGNRSTKTDASGFVAFDTPNHPPLGEAGVDLTLHRERLLPRGAGGLRCDGLGRSPVGAFRIFPGMQAESLAAALGPLGGLVLECYGTGNAPVRDRGLLRVLGDACDRGVAIVAVSQCARGRVELSRYETGHELAEVGVVSGRDMTVEAALTKLCWLLDRDELSLAERRRLLGEDLRGELTR